MSRNKIQYEVANNGREAIDKWRSGSFHIIFVSLTQLTTVLAGPDGMFFYRWISNCPSWTGLKQRRRFDGLKGLQTLASSLALLQLLRRLWEGRLRRKAAEAARAHRRSLFRARITILLILRSKQA